MQRRRVFIKLVWPVSGAILGALSIGLIAGSRFVNVQTQTVSSEPGFQATLTVAVLHLGVSWVWFVCGAVVGALIGAIVAVAIRRAGSSGK